MLPDTDQPEARGPKGILVVDDDPVVCEMLARVLAGDGYSTRQARNGDEALRIASGFPVDLVLLDLGLPGKSGWDTLAALTRDNPRLEVIIITARPDQAPMARALGVGTLFEKPLDFTVLLQAVAGKLAGLPAFGAARAAAHP